MLRFRVAVLAAVLGPACGSVQSDPPAPDGQMPQPDGAPSIPGLVAYWKFDEATGVDTLDSSGNNAGVLDGTGVRRVAGGFPDAMFPDPGALDFVGQDGVVRVAPKPALALLKRFTVALWILPRGAGSSGAGRILDKRQDATQGGWDIDLCGPGVAGGCTNGLVLTAGRIFSGSYATWATPPGALVTGIWHHLAFVLDSTAGTGAPTFYIDGVGLTTLVQTPPQGALVDDANVALTIGGRGSLDRTMDGMLDDVRIYDRALSAEEIGQLRAGSER